MVDTKTDYGRKVTVQRNDKFCDKLVENIAFI